MRITVNGTAYKSSVVDSNNQRCLNLFPMDTGPNGTGKDQEPPIDMLVPADGSRLIQDFGTGQTRLLKKLGSYGYMVVGNTVYRLTINPLSETIEGYTNLGTIGTTTGVVYAAANPTQVIFVDGSQYGYLYTPGSGVFQRINDTDADFTGGRSVVFVDGYFVVNQPNTGKFFFSALNDGLSWDPLDVATAESSVDNLLTLAVSKGDLWPIGADSSELWYNAANPTGAPFSPRTGLEMKIGCGAQDSVVVIDDLLIFLDNRGYVVQSNVSPLVRDNNSGYDLKIISTDALTQEWLSYDNMSDAIATSYISRGHLMYQISFISAKKTWTFDYITKKWHERSWYNSNEDAQEHCLGQFYLQEGNLLLMAGVRDGKLYSASDRLYTDNSTPIFRISQSPFFYDPSFYNLIGINRLELKMMTGQASQGSDPQVTLKYSKDGGHTWSSALDASIGATGEYEVRPLWNRLGIARKWQFQFTVVANTDFAILDCVTNVELEKE